MERPKKKPPSRVVVITGETAQRKVYTQEWYRLTQRRQAEMHLMYGSLLQDLIMCKMDLKGGAEEEPGEFYFDPDTLLIRSRKVATKRRGGKKAGNADDGGKRDEHRPSSSEDHGRAPTR